MPDPILTDAIERLLAGDDIGRAGAQAAVGVVSQGLRPEMPRRVPPDLAQLVRQCWAAVPDQRPSFPQICTRLAEMLDVMKQQPAPAATVLQ